MRLRNQSFKQAAFWSTAINALSQGLALLFSMLMAAVFGAQESTDVLFYCLGVFVLLSGLIQTVNVNVLIPENMRRRHQVGEDDAMAFTNRFMAAFAVLITGLTAWILLNPVGALTLISKFPEEALQRNSRLVFWLLATMPLQMMAQLLLDVLVSYKFLTLPAVLSCVSRIINILFVLFFHRPLGVISMAMGLLLGLVLQILLNTYLLRHVIHWRFSAWATRVGGSVYRNIAWTQVGTLAATVAGYLPLFLFSGFSAGVLTSLNYARRLSEAPVGLLTSQITGVLSVKFNELAAQRKQEELASEYGRLSRLIIFVLVPMSILLALAGPDLVRLLFGRGAFQDEQALRTTSLLFSLFVLKMPLIAVLMVIARYFVAQQQIRYGTTWQIISNILLAVLVLLFVRGWGPLGLPVGMFLHLLLYMGLLSVFIVRRFPLLRMGPVWRALFATFATGLLVAFPLWIARLRWAGGWPSWATAALLGLLFVTGYGLVSRFLPPDRMAWQYGLQQARLIRSRWRRGWPRKAMHE